MSSYPRAQKWGLVGAVAAVTLMAGGALILESHEDSDARVSPTTVTEPSLTLPATPRTRVASPQVSVPVETAAPTTAAPATPTLPAVDEVPADDATAQAAGAAPTSTPAPSTTQAPPLPQPVAPPSDPRAFEEDVVLGGLRIPKLGVDETFREGIRLTTIDKGPGHWPGSAMPGEVGNVVVAAHRTSHGAPFRHIDTLVAGDEVVFTTEKGESRYVVTGTQVVEPDALWIVEPTATPTATLFACHPPGSVAQRIVVHLELTS